MFEEASAACLLAGFGVGTGAGVDGTLFDLQGGIGDGGIDSAAEVADGFCEGDATFDLVETLVLVAGIVKCFCCGCDTAAALLDTDFAAI